MARSKKVIEPPVNPLLENGFIQNGTVEEDIKDRNPLRYPVEKYGFDPYKVTLCDGKHRYLPVNGQIQWFNAVYPTGRIDEEVIALDPNFCAVKVHVFKDVNDSTPASSALASRHRVPDDMFKCHHLDEAVRGGIGAALKNLGFTLPNILPEDDAEGNKEKPLPNLDNMFQKQGTPPTESPAQVQKAPVRTEQKKPAEMPVCPPAEWQEPIPGTFVPISDDELLLNPEPKVTTPSKDVAPSAQEKAIPPVKEQNEIRTTEMHVESPDPTASELAAADPSLTTPAENGQGMTMEAALAYKWPFGQMQGQTVKEMLATDTPNAIRTFKWVRDKYGANGRAHNLEVKLVANTVLQNLKDSGYDVG